MVHQKADCTELEKVKGTIGEDTTEIRPNRKKGNRGQWE